MKSAFVFVLALVMAAPVAAIVTAPTVAEAQVLAGANASRRPPPRRSGLSERDRERLYEAQDQVAERETALMELNAIIEAGGTLTEAQTRQMADHQRRLQTAQQTVERLEAKRERMGG